MSDQPCEESLLRVVCRFRWASLQIQNLCNPVRMKLESDVEDAMDHLPDTLLELYATIFQQIQQSPPEARSIAISTLQWLLCAHVPLSSKQMIDLASPPSKILYSEILIEDDILSVCCNLVVLDRELDCFRFAHISVQDFFNGRAGFEYDAVHTMAVGRCLDLYYIEPLDQGWDIYGTFQTRQSFEYAATYWIVHYKCINDKCRTVSLRNRVVNFLYTEIRFSQVLNNGCFTCTTMLQHKSAPTVL